MRYALPCPVLSSVRSLEILTLVVVAVSHLHVEHPRLWCVVESGLVGALLVQTVHLNYIS